MEECEGRPAERLPPARQGRFAPPGRSAADEKHIEFEMVPSAAATNGRGESRLSRSGHRIQRRPQRGIQVLSTRKPLEVREVR